jgi:hypothetical protein
LKKYWGGKKEKRIKYLLKWDKIGFLNTICKKSNFFRLAGKRKARLQTPA